MITLPHGFKKCGEDGDICKLEIAAGRNQAEYTGGSHEDSDLFKIMEGAAYCLEMFPVLSFPAPVSRSSGLYLKPFKAVTGIICPGCSPPGQAFIAIRQ